MCWVKLARRQGFRNRKGLVPLRVATVARDCRPWPRWLNGQAEKSGRIRISEEFQVAEKAKYQVLRPVISMPATSIVFSGYRRTLFLRVPRLLATCWIQGSAYSSCRSKRARMSLIHCPAKGSPTASSLFFVLPPNESHESCIHQCAISLQEAKSQHRELDEKNWTCGTHLDSSFCSSTVGPLS
jgi:hypothetical protein